jgi:hypothetical protein
MPNMTDNDLRLLPLDALYEFTLYYGEKAIGFPVQENNDWYITKASDQKSRKKVLPAQIESYRKITNNYLGSLSNPKSISINGIHKFKTLVVVGAGASYNYSFNESVSKPPLTKDLFNNVFIKQLSEYPGV